MAQIVVEMSADEAKLFRAFQNVMSQQDKMERGFKKNADAAKMVEKSMADSVSYIAKMAMGYLSVQTAIGGIVSMLERKAELEKKAADASASLAESQGMALQNLGATSAEERDKVIDQVRSMAAKRMPKGGEKTAWEMLASSLSATGGDATKALGSMEVAMQIAPASVEAMKTMSGAIADIGKATGSGNNLENLGFLLAVGKTSKTKTLEALGGSIAPAVSALSKIGATPEQAGALTTALGQAMQDNEGHMTRTAAIALGTQLREMVPENNVYEYKRDERGRVKKTLKYKGTGLKTLDEKIAYLQTNEQARAQFLADASFEKMAQIPVEQLFSGGQTAKDYAAFKKGFVARSEWSKLGQQQIELLNSTPEARAAALQRSVEANVEEINSTIAGKKQQLGGLFSGANLMEQLNKSGIGWGKWTALKTDLAMSSVARAFDPTALDVERNYELHMRQRINTLRYGTDNPTGNQMNAGTTGSAEQLQTAEILERYLKAQLEQAKALREEIARLTKLQEERNKQARQPSPAAVQAQAEKK